MATHDFIINNQNGANFRSDLNSALAAIVSNNSSSSSPATTYPYMWWADTANDVMKQRNSADTGWIEVFTLSTGANSTSEPCFRAYKNAEQGITENVWEKVVFEVEAFDLTSDFDLANNKAIPSVEGYYLMTGRVSHLSEYNDEALLVIYKNGALVSYLDHPVQPATSSNHEEHLGGSTLLYANGTTDYFELYYYTEASTNKIDNADAEFSAVLVRTA